MIRENETHAGVRTPAQTQMAQIERATKNYADKRAALASIVTTLNDELEKITRQHLAAIKKAVVNAAAAEHDLRTEIELAPDCFEKPRTVIFHGVKVGFQKGKGGIEFTDEDKVIERIKVLFDCPENYLRTIEKPDKEALAKLPVADLKKLGCTVVDTADQVVIKPTDTEVDKQVNALLKGALKEAAAGN